MPIAAGGIPACPLCRAAACKRSWSVDRRYRDALYTLDLARCRFCSFVFLVNPPAVVYDDGYLEVEEVNTGGDRLARFRCEERVADIAARLSPASDHRILDIGVGDGLFMSVAEAAGFQVFGLDINAGAPETVKRAYGVRGPVVVGDLGDAFPGYAFDVIHMNEVVEHVPRPQTFLSRCADRLTDGGRLIVQTGNIDSLAARAYGARWDYFRPVHLGYFSSRTLRAAMERAGLTVVLCRTIDWRGPSVLATCRALVADGRARDGLRLAALWLSAHVHGLRRTVLVHAVRSDTGPGAGT